MQEVITLCEKKEIGHLIVYKMDRLTRRTLDLLTLVENVFKPNDVQFHSITERVDTSTAQGKFFLTIIGAMAQMKRDLVAERTKEALQYKKSKFEAYSPTPFGFDRENEHITPNQKELKIIKLMRKLKKKGLSYQAIINKLNEKDIPTKNKKSWSKSTIWGILKNPIYDNLIPIRS